MTKRFWAVASLALLLHTTSVWGDEKLQPPDTPIPPTLFGLHIHHMMKGAPQPTPWPAIPFGTWRMWDCYVVWANLEPQKGRWDFTALDKSVALAQDHHVDILMPLGMPPPWASARPTEPPAFRPGSAAEPKDMQDWRNYVRTLATRYKGRIHAWELWNEPNLREFYSGSVVQMVALEKETSEILKQVDPANILVSPAATGAFTGPTWLANFLAAGGGDYADVIGFHFYVNPAPPEKMIPLVQQVKAILQNSKASGKPIFSTESGWAIQNTQKEVKPAPGGGFNSVVFPPDQAGAYVARSYILSWASGVSRFYWYSWDNAIMGLTDADGKTLKAPAITYAETEKWLVGARMTSCRADASQTWVCELSREGGYQGWIVWNPDRNLSFAIPTDWKARTLRDLLGKKQAIASVTSVDIGLSPILLDTL